MQVSRQSSIDTGIEDVLRNNPSNTRTETRSIHQVSRSYQGGRSFLDLSTRYWEDVGNAIRKSLRSSRDSKVLRRYRGGVKLAFKISFLRCEKHRHECNPTCNSTNETINILSSQNHLSIKILSTWISKTHTHTHTHTISLTNFYISKNKSRQFSKHTLTHVKPCDGQITFYLHMYHE